MSRHLDVAQRGSFCSIKPLCIHKSFILCLWTSTAHVYWLHCTSFSLDQISAFAPEQPLEVFLKNFDCFFALCAHTHINSAPFRGLLCLLLLLCPRGGSGVSFSYFWVCNETIFIMFIGFWWRLHWHVRAVSGYPRSYTPFCVVYHKSQKKRRGARGVGLMSHPLFSGPILFHGSDSAILESSLTRRSTLLTCSNNLLFFYLSILAPVPWRPDYLWH